MYAKNPMNTGGGVLDIFQGIFKIPQENFYMIPKPFWGSVAYSKGSSWKAAVAVNFHQLETPRTSHKKQVHNVFQAMFKIPWEGLYDSSPFLGSFHSDYHVLHTNHSQWNC